MKIHLAIVIGENGYIKEDLYVANNIDEFDRYTGQFSDSSEIRIKYQDIIQEFLLDNRYEIKKRETKNGKYRGRIAAYYIKNNKLEFIKVAYKNKPVIRNYDELDSVDKQFDFLMQRFDKASKNIEKFMENNKNVFPSKKVQICIEQFGKFGYILSDDEIYSLKLYYESNNKKYLKDFFSKMKTRLRKNDILNSDKMVVVTKYGDISFNEEMIDDKMSLNKKRISDDCNDDLFMKLLSEENYEELHNLYSIDEIERNMNLEKERRK